MKVKWLIEDDAFPEDTTPTTDALKRHGIEYKSIKYKPFDMVAACNEIFPGEDCVVFQGSLGLGKQLKNKTRWIPGVYYNIPKFECISYNASAKATPSTDGTALNKYKDVLIAMIRGTYQDLSIIHE